MKKLLNIQQRIKQQTMDVAEVIAVLICGIIGMFFIFSSKDNEYKSQEVPYFSDDYDKDDDGWI